MLQQKGQKPKEKKPGEILQEMLNPLQDNVLKTVKKVQKDQVTEAMNQGVPAENILQQIGINVATPQVQVDNQSQDGAKVLQKLLPSKGPFSSAQVTQEGIQQAGPFTFGTTTESLLNNLLKLSQIQQAPMEQEKFDLSKKRFELEEQMEKRRVGAEERRVLEDTKNTIYNSGAELTNEDLKDPNIAKIIVPLIKQNNIEPIIDPDSGVTIYSLPPKGVLEKTRKDVAAINLKKKELAKELSDYFAVGDSLPTAEGMGRFAQGAELYAGSIFQSDPQGALAAQLKGLNKRLRVKLVRAAGDVGNLNIVEQDAAERLLYNFSDSTSLRTLKRAFLMDLTKAVDDNSPMEIKNVISKWTKQEQQMQGGQAQSKYVRTGKNKSGQKVGQLADGTIEVINE